MVCTAQLAGLRRFVGTKKGVKEFVFAIITGFLGRTEINFFEVGFQKPRWSLQDLDNFILFETHRFWVSEKIVSVCVYLAWVKMINHFVGIKPAFIESCGRCEYTDSPHFRWGLIALLGPFTSNHTQ